MILHSEREGNDCIRKLRCHCIQILHSDINSVFVQGKCSCNTRICRVPKSHKSYSMTRRMYYQKATWKLIRRCYVDFVCVKSNERNTLLQQHEIKYLHRILKCFLKKSIHSKIEMVNKKGAPKYVNKTHQKAPRFWLSLAGTPRSCTAKFSLHIVCREFTKKKERKLFSWI